MRLLPPAETGSSVTEPPQVPFVGLSLWESTRERRRELVSPWQRGGRRDRARCENLLHAATAVLVRDPAAGSTSTALA